LYSHHYNNYGRLSKPPRAKPMAAPVGIPIKRSGVLGENVRLGVPGRDHVLDAPVEGAAVLVGGLVAAHSLKLLDAEPL
jgi:hypothetical protein